MVSATELAPRSPSFAGPPLVVVEELSSADFGASLIDERGHQRGGEGADILTAKALALSALLVAVATAGTERQLDADSSWHPRHEGYPPHVKPGW